MLTQVYKSLCQMIVSFTQMSCYNVYVPLLLRMANDVEEDPGPTVYDVVDPSKTICADFSQSNTRRFRENAGKQCVAMSLTAIIHNQITNINAWDSTFLNVILSTGDSLYTCISNYINKTFLLLTDVPKIVSVSDQMYSLQYSVSFAGDLFMATTNLPYYSLENTLNNLFLDSELNYQHCMKWYLSTLH